MIRTSGLVKEFQGFRAVGGENGVDPVVDRGDLDALVGPNGAGNTTLFNMLTGFLPSSAGTIEIDDEDVTLLPAEKIARRGVARSFQITRPFQELWLIQHVELALQGRDGQGYRFWQSDKLLYRFADDYHALEQSDHVGTHGFSQLPCRHRVDVVGLVAPGGLGDSARRPRRGVQAKTHRPREPWDKYAHVDRHRLPPLSPTLSPRTRSAVHVSAVTMVRAKGVAQTMVVAASVGRHEGRAT